jgi:hypothetical protein
MTTEVFGMPAAHSHVWSTTTHVIGAPSDLCAR